MPDLSAGTIVKDTDTPPTVTDFQVGSFTFDSATFGVDADSGTYVTCGVAFLAATSGRALILYDGDLDHSSGTASTELAPAVRTGSTVGSGVSVLAASSDDAIRNVGTDNRRYGGHRLITGLTPGDPYNVRLEHRTSGASGTIQRRRVTVMPCT